MLRHLACLVLSIAMIAATGAALGAATAKDLIGSWVVDTDATWEVVSKDPAMAQQLKSIPADQQGAVKSMVLAQMAKLRIDVTADKATTTAPDGSIEENPYKVAKIDGDVITVEGTAAKKDKGQGFDGEITVKDGRLHMRNKGADGGPDLAIVLKPAAK